MDKPKPQQTFRHFKGSSYVVLGIGKYEPNQEEVVIYQSLKDDQIWVRPLVVWNEAVSPGQPRFKAEALPLRVQYHVFMNGDPTGIVIWGDNKVMSCGCLSNCDIALFHAEEAVRERNLFPKGHCWVSRNDGWCNEHQGDGSYGSGQVKLLPEGVGFIWLESMPLPEEEDEE